MTDATEQDKDADRLQALRDALHEDQLSLAQTLLDDMHPAEIALLLESLPEPERITVWEMVSPELDGEVLTYVNDEVRTTLIREMDAQELVAAIEELDTDDLADILPEMPEEVIQQILTTMDAQHRQRLEAVLSYPEDSAGGLMNVDTITVREDITLDVVLRYLRWHGEIPETTDSLMVVDREGKYLGLLSLTDLLTRNPDLSVAEVMIRDVDGIEAHTHASDVAQLFEMHDLISAPVVDDEGKLLGRITIDDVVDVIREEADHSVLSMAGLRGEEGLFTNIRGSLRNRWAWIAVNLVTALVASRVIGLFEGSIEKIVALAALMPIVAGIGGNSGNQTITMIVRGLALGHVHRGNTRLLFLKELGIAMINGLIWGSILGVITYLLYGSVSLGLVMTGAMTLNLLLAAVMGVLIPLILEKLGRDPAEGSSVLITAITDSGGFFIFLGLATIFLI